jgi:hypothetical protein
MKLPRDLEPAGGYGIVTAQHSAASAAALTELALLASAAARQRGSHPLHVRLSHIEHGAALSPQLFGFPILLATGESVSWPSVPFMEARPPASGLWPPEATSADDPLLYAVVANHPVPVQIEHTLGMLAKLVGRQELISAGKRVDVAEIDRLAAETDTRTTTAVTDVVKSQGWRAAAQAISARSVGAGLPLAVTYSPILMGADELALRASILRRVYNEMPNVRSAIDKVAMTLSQGLIVARGGSERISASARDLLDVGSTRTYLAHLARDAFVCGNGYLTFGAVPDEDIRLLSPEAVTILDAKAGRVRDSSTGIVYVGVLHVTGAEQRDSPYGVSILEPFVHPQAQRELMRWTLETADAWEKHQRSVRESALAWIRRDVPLARRTLDSIAAQIDATLVGPASLDVRLPADLYFPGHEVMAPAAEGIALMPAREPGGIGTGAEG